MVPMMILALRCEWAMSKARAERWTEEVDLVVEEMRRVITFLIDKANWWLTQARARGIGGDIGDGIEAYAMKQSHIMKTMARRFGEKWYKRLEDKNLPTHWPEECIPRAVEELEVYKS
jgi:hypothetical protein